MTQLFRSVRTVVKGLAIHAMIPAERAVASPIPVVLVHGLGLSHRYLMPTAEQLASRFRVYVPDLPGFGESGHPDKVLDMAGLADALLDWCDAMGLGRVSLLGNSQGCQVIIDLAARYPERLGRGVLQGPTTPPKERSWIKQYVRWRRNAPFAPPSLGPITWGEYPKAGIWRVLKTFHYSIVDRPEDKLASIKAPMLVVRGEHDPICHQDWAEEVARRLPRGQLVVIPGVAHTLVYTSPQQLAAAVSDFLAEGPPAAT